MDRSHIEGVGIRQKHCLYLNAKNLDLTQTTLIKKCFAEQPILSAQSLPKVLSMYSQTHTARK